MAGRKPKVDKVATTRLNLESYRQQLKRIAARTLRDGSGVNEQIHGIMGQAAGELTNAPLHLGDMGTEEYLRDLNAVLLENEQHLATEALVALRRIDDGTFGVCENCGQRIRKERLDAVPYVRHCVACAETAGNASRANLNVGRPQGPADTLAPEGQMGEDRRRKAPPAIADPDSETDWPDELGDRHAAGTPGGGTATGGLAGSNIGRGEPDVARLQNAMGSGKFDVQESRKPSATIPTSGRSGGAVGGTPAGKRAK